MIIALAGLFKIFKRKRTTAATREDPSPTVDKTRIFLRIKLRPWSKTLLWWVNLTPIAAICDTPRPAQTTRGTRSSMGQLGDMILDLNDMLCDEFYPIVGKEKSHCFETIGLISWQQHQAICPSHTLLLSSLACLPTRDSPSPGYSLFPEPYQGGPHLPLGQHWPNYGT